MKLYTALHKSRIRLQIHGEVIEIRITPDFYSKVKGTQSFQMFFDNKTNTKIAAVIKKHRDRLPFFDKLKYIFLRNTAWVLVDNDVQPLIPTRVLEAYATLSLDARVVHVIRKPDGFAADDLALIERIQEAHVNGKADTNSLLI